MKNNKKYYIDVTITDGVNKSVIVDGLLCNTFGEFCGINTSAPYLIRRGNTVPYSRADLAWSFTTKRDATRAAMMCKIKHSNADEERLREFPGLHPYVADLRVVADGDMVVCVRGGADGGAVDYDAITGERVEEW